jgi:hypothetical protein
MERLRHMIGPRYASPAVSALVKMGVLERNPSYSAGRFSRSYRLASAYRERPTVARVVRAPALARKIHDGEAQKNAEAIGSDTTLAAMWANLHALGFAPDAGAFVAGHTYASPHTQAARVLTLDTVQHGTHWLRRDKETGRVFHTVTQCPRELRRFLLLASEPVREVDMANAQPFFLLSLYPESEDERNTFAATVGQGRFYEALFDAMPRTARRSWGSDRTTWDEPGSSHRDRFKKHVMRCVLYSESSGSEEATAVFTACGELFPWLAGELALRRAATGGASALARAMQRREAELVLGRVVPRILAEMPDSRPITIHDGLLCPARFAEAAKFILEEETAATYGVRPLVRVKKS